MGCPILSMVLTMIQSGDDVTFNNNMLHSIILSKDNITFHYIIPSGDDIDIYYIIFHYIIL